MIYLLLFLSGLAGLVYEIAWSRQLGLLFGHTVYASALVLAAYFAGMALGYWIAGAAERRIGSPLWAYGLAELIVAGWAAVTPVILNGLKSPAVAGLLNNPDPALQTAYRAVVVFFVLLPATAAMGSTLPFIATHLSRTFRLADSRIALAYSANTAGAVSGVLLATFVFILFMGVVASNWLAAVISGLCGVAAIVLAKFPGQQVAAGDEDATDIEDGEQPAVARSGNGIWYWLAGLSGGGVLALEVLYTKMFALVLHNSTYTFGVVVAVFLLSLALGSWLVSRYADRYPPEQYLPPVMAAGALLVLAGVVFFQQFTQLDYFRPGGGFASYILGVIALGTFVMLPGTLLLGTILPWTWRRLGSAGRGAAVGRLTAVNTLSASAGALLASFVLLPWAGLWMGIALVCALYCTTALGLAWGRREFSRFAATCIALVIPAAAATMLIHQPVARVYKGTRVVFARETPYGYIDVLKKDNGELWLRQNNNYTLGASYGDDSELRQGHIPLLLHGDPREVCFLGLATGITASSALMHTEAQHITAVELIPEVVEAAGLYSEYNQGITGRDDVEIVVNDARHFLYATGDSFDVIISDLFVPWHSQTGYLYTVEHYRAARQRLKPGGLFCQWVPLYQVSATELELIASSFAAVFPVVTLWRGEFTSDTPLLALIGSEQPLDFDFGQVAQRIRALPDPVSGPDQVLNDPVDLLDLYMGDWHAEPGALLNTDEHPRVEFLAPISQRKNLRLTGDALKAYYSQVIDRLPTSNLRYRPGVGRREYQPGDGRRRQLGVD